MLALASISLPTIAYSEEASDEISKTFLTYLAQLVEVDGKWVHPTELAPSTDNTSDNKTQPKQHPNEQLQGKVKDNTMNNDKTKPNNNKQEKK